MVERRADSIDSGGALVRSHFMTTNLAVHDRTSRFTVNGLFAGGAYLKVDQTVGSLIDWVSDSLLPRRNLRLTSGAVQRSGMHMFISASKYILTTSLPISVH